MRRAAFTLTSLACIGLLVFGSLHLAWAGDEPPEPGEFCILPAESFRGMSAEQWRAKGPEGLSELMELMKPVIEARKQYNSADPLVRSKFELSADDRAKLLLLDQVAQQRDAYASGLYWHTDLDTAVAQAKEEGKPVLSLRMLGQLVDEYSCANSRFFRTVLYADESIGKLLREQFVLHWESVRPVPVITIDMGDGRTIKRTITGNSAHYVLDPNGRVVDGLPGLYGSGTFERMVQASGMVARQLHDSDEERFTEIVAFMHKEGAAHLDRAWAQYMRTIQSQDKAKADGAEAVEAGTINLRQTLVIAKNQAPMPDARAAGQLALAGKFRVERPLVDAVIPKGSPTAEQATDDAKLWKRVAAAYTAESRMDAGSRSLMAAKAPQEPIEEAMGRAISKSIVESPLARMVRNFEGGLAVETARNEHLLRRQLHDWFTQAKAPLDLTKLNKRVYAELFLTPDEDPWLGLVPPDTYSALDGGGLIN